MEELENEITLNLHFMHNTTRWHHMITWLSLCSTFRVKTIEYRSSIETEQGVVKGGSCVEKGMKIFPSDNPLPPENSGIDYRVVITLMALRLVHLLHILS